MKNDVVLVRLDEIEKIDLPAGSWSKMVLDSASLKGNQSSLGYSLFKPGTVLSAVSHETEEVAIVISGQGELRLDERAIQYGPGDALFIPPNTWHAVVNTGDDDVIMVFSFPHPNYPPTKRSE